MSIPAWDPDEYDRRIRSERAARERISRSPAPANKGTDTTINYTDRSLPRGEATPAELERRARAERAMRRNAANAANANQAEHPRRRPWPLPEPKPTTSGRWLARVVHRGRVYQRTFDTEQQARDFIKQVTNQTNGDS